MIAGPPEMASMLSLRQPELAEALEEVGQYGVRKIELMEAAVAGGARYRAEKD